MFVHCIIFPFISMPKIVNKYLVKSSLDVINNIKTKLLFFSIAPPENLTATKSKEFPNLNKTETRTSSEFSCLLKTTTTQR